MGIVSFDNFLKKYYDITFTEGPSASDFGFIFYSAANVAFLVEQGKKNDDPSNNIHRRFVNSISKCWEYVRGKLPRKTFSFRDNFNLFHLAIQSRRIKMNLDKLLKDKKNLKPEVYLNGIVGVMQEFNGLLTFASGVDNKKDNMDEI